MEEFDFEHALDRAGHDALAIDALGAHGVPGRPKPGFDPIPMWVADMSFATAPAITRALVERAEHPAFGYFRPRAEYFQSIIDWHRRRNGVEGLTASCIGYENGVLGGVASALEAFSSPGDRVLVHAPTYIGFNHTVARSGRRLEYSPLVRDDQGVWRMDFDDMERRIIDGHIHVVVFCSPHNPSGRVWERWELERAAELFRRHDCVVICDEIWSDLLLDGHEHIPFQSVSDDARMRTVALYAPSKTFNLAGLVGSYHIVYNPYLRDRLVSAANRTGYNAMNVLSMHALIAAYSADGERWLDALLPVLSNNARYAVGFVRAHFDGVSVARPQGTYMLFLDCAQWCREHETTPDELLRAAWDVGVACQDGRPFGGEATVRLNLALPHAREVEAFERLDRYVFNR
ncbi:MAG: aminotransferase class I/II-fold pyridoxal phosphate-dependent enzyme [Eggerthellaceae bacterium]|jgi:cystathionine beta-lyase